MELVDAGSIYSSGSSGNSRSSSLGGYWSASSRSPASSRYHSAWSFSEEVITDVTNVSQKSSVASNSSVKFLDKAIYCVAAAASFAFVAAVVAAASLWPAAAAAMFWFVIAAAVVLFFACAMTFLLLWLQASRTTAILM